MFLLLENVAREFRLLPWRDNVTRRNDLIRTTALYAIDDRISELEKLIKELRRLVHYADMARNDRMSFRKATSCLRKIVRGWHLLSDQLREDFRAGKIPPSSLAFRVEEARKSAVA